MNMHYMNIVELLALSSSALENVKQVNEYSETCTKTQQMSGDDLEKVQNALNMVYDVLSHVAIRRCRLIPKLSDLD